MSLKDQCSGFKSHQWIRDHVQGPPVDRESCFKDCVCTRCHAQVFLVYPDHVSMVTHVSGGHVQGSPVYQGFHVQDHLCTRNHMSSFNISIHDHMTSKVSREYVLRVIFGPGVTCQGSFVDPGVSSVISVLVTQH